MAESTSLYAPVPLNTTGKRCPASITPVNNLTNSFDIMRIDGHGVLQGYDSYVPFVNTYTSAIVENPDDTTQSSTNNVKATYLDSSGVIYQWENQGPAWYTDLSSTTGQQIINSSVSMNNDWNQVPPCGSNQDPVDDPPPPGIPPVTEYVVDMYLCKNKPRCQCGCKSKSYACTLL